MGQHLFQSTTPSLRKNGLLWKSPHDFHDVQYVVLASFTSSMCALDSFIPWLTINKSLKLITQKWLIPKY